MEHRVIEYLWNELELADVPAISPVYQELVKAGYVAGEEISAYDTPYLYEPSQPDGVAAYRAMRFCLILIILLAEGEEL